MKTIDNRALLTVMELIFTSCTLAAKHYPEYTIQKGSSIVLKILQCYKTNEPSSKYS